MSRGSSRRWILAPMSWVTAMSAPPRRDLGLPGRRPAHRLGCTLDGLDDVHVARTPAEVAFEAPADLVFGRVWVLFQKIGRGHDESGRAVTALQSVLVPESLLDRVELMTALPSTWIVHAPHWLVSQPMCVPVRPTTSRR